MTQSAASSLAGAQAGPRLALLVLTLAGATVGPASAQEGSRELRVAVMQHDMLHLSAGDRESGADVEVALLSRPITRLDALGRPQAYVSGSLNSDGDTNFASVGLAWRRSLSERLTGELQFGYAVHDGLLDADDPVEARSRLLLGSRDLFRTAVGLDWTLSQDVRIGLQWVHLSHGQILGEGRNQGSDSAGLVMTYRLR